MASATPIDKAELLMEVRDFLSIIVWKYGVALTSISAEYDKQEGKPAAFALRGVNMKYEE